MPLVKLFLSGFLILLATCAFSQRFNKKSRNKAFGRYVPPIVFHFDGKFFICRRRTCRLQKATMWYRNPKIRKPESKGKRKNRTLDVQKKPKNRQ